MNYYVQRDASGKINGLFSNAQDRAQECLADSDPAVMAFLAGNQTEIVDGKRRSAYQFRSDPLFFKWQRGEATQQDWTNEIAAIKAEYPKPEK